MAVPELPQELIDQVIDTVAQSNRKTLSVCALTCRSWVTRAQFHIHEHISFDFSRMKAKVEDVPEVTKRTVRHLKIIMFTVSLNDTQYGIWIQLCRCPLVRELTIDNVSLRYSKELLQKFFAPLLPTLSTLTFSRCEFRDLQQFTAFVRSFLRLEKLVLYRMLFREPETVDGGISLQVKLRESIKTVRLRTVMIDMADPFPASVSCQTVSAWLAFLPTSVLRLLDLSWLHKDGMARISSFLTQAGPCLHHLRIRVDHSQFYDLNGIEKCGNLRTLAFNYLGYITTHKQPEQENVWIGSVLSSIDSPHLHCVEFQCRHPDTLDEIDFSSIDSILSQHQFPGLITIGFLFDTKGRKPLESIYEKLRNSFPRTAPRCTLCIEFELT